MRIWLWFDDTSAMSVAFDVKHRSSDGEAVYCQLLFFVRSKTGPGWLGIWRFEPEGAATRLRWTGELTNEGLCAAARAIDWQANEFPDLQSICWITQIDRE